MSIINNLNSIWNDSTALFYGYEMNFTDGAGGAPLGSSLSRFMSLKNNGVEKFAVNKDGLITSPSLILNALSYVTANGVADCWSGLNQALLAAAGKTLWLPAGSYLLKYQGTYNASDPSGNPSLYIPSNTTVLMDPEAIILSQGAPVGVGNTTQSIFRNIDQGVSGNVNITIIGGQIRTAGSAYGGSTFIGMRYVDRLFIRGVQLQDIQGSSRCEIDHCTNVNIADYYTGYPIGIAKVLQPNQSTLYGFEDGIRLCSGCNGVTLNDFDINSGDDSIVLNNEPSNHIGASGNDIQNVQIGNGICTSKAGHTLRMLQESTMTDGVHKNINVSNVVGIPVNTLDGVSIQDQSARHAITNVTINNIFIDCGNVTRYGFNTLNVDTITVSNCTAFNPGREGFYFVACYRARLINPSVSASRLAGFDQVSFNSLSADSSIIGGTLLDSQQHAITIDTSLGQISIVGVNINAPTANGINISGNSIATQITGNQFNNINAGKFCVSETAGCDYTVFSSNNMSGTAAGRRIDYSNVGANSSYQDEQRWIHVATAGGLTYTSLKDVTNTAVISLGDGTDQTNYYNNTNHVFRTRAFSQVAAINNGLLMGAATGGDKGLGSINIAADIYKNNTAYTNPKWALKHYFRGEVDKEGPYAPSFEYKGLVPLPQLEEAMASELEIPLMLKNPDEGLFGRGDMLLAALEEAYIYITQLHNRVKKLEDK